MTAGEVVRAVGYIRVSTEDQAAEGLSLAAQRERLAAYCTAQGWELVAVYEDAGVSAKSLERAGLQAALRSIDAGEASVLLAMKLDRLTRSVADLGRLIERSQERGFQLAAVSESLDTTTAGGRMMANILASVAQWEREATGERTREALAHKQRNGEHLGMVPFGFRVAADGRLHEAPQELATIRRMKRLRQRGMSLRKIADKLNAGEVEARRGSWSKSTVHDLVSTHLSTRKARHLAA